MCKGLLTLAALLAITVFVSSMSYLNASKPIVEISSRTGQPVRALNANGSEIPLEGVLGGTYETVYVK